MSSSDADSPDQAAPQPPPTVVPLRPYKTLAPKPASAKRSIRRAGSKAHLFPFVRQVPRSPVCPICQRNNCQLASHKSFLKSITSKEKSKSASSSPEAQPRPSQVANTLYKKSYAYQFASFVDTDLAASRIDPFVSLPIPDSSHPQLHALLHDFFTLQINRSLNFPRPSAFTTDPVGGAIAPAAMTDSAVCLSVVAASATSAGMRTYQQPRNVTSMSFYRQALKVLRARMVQTPTLPTEQTIMAAATLWGVAVFFGDAGSVRQLRNTVHDLVKLRGGPAGLGLGGMLAEYVLWFDMFGASYLKEKPYMATEAGPVPIQGISGTTYGAAFHTSSILDTLHPELIDICVVHCRMTELLEKALLEGPNTQDYMAFYAMLRWVSIRRPQFRAQCFNMGTIDECVSLTIEIYRTNVFATQEENRLFNLDHCSELQRALLCTDIAALWGENIQLLIWVLFTVGTISPKWDTREWFVDLLYRAVPTSTKFWYKSRWPHWWRERTLQNLTSFIWSKVRFAKTFESICDELESRNVSDMSSGSEMVSGASYPLWSSGDDS